MVDAITADMLVHDDLLIKLPTSAIPDGELHEYIHPH